MIDREKAEKAFIDYTSSYDNSDPMIRQKIDHTFRVADLSDKLAKSLCLDDKGIDLSWLIGLLHDFGRFEQIKRFGTFSDSQSVDHAELGADILFKDGKIQLFSDAGLLQDDFLLIETAVRLHNKLSLPDNLDENAKVFCQLIRDADKLDIFRVLYEIPFETLAGKNSRLTEKEKASEECMEYVYKHSCIPRELVQSRFELRIAHICMAFELCFKESRKIAEEDGYVNKLLSVSDEKGNPIWNEAECQQLEILKKELEKAWSMA